MEKQDDKNISMMRILKVSIPLIISMLSINIMTFFDRAFISNYDITQFSASVPANYLATTLTSIFLGIITFVSSIISQYYGAGKKDECSKCLWQSIYLSGFFTALLVLSLPITSNIFKWIGHEESLILYEKQYFYFILASNCVQLFSTAFISFFSALGITKIQMIVGISTNIINVVCDWVLIYGKFGFKEYGGVVGAGLGTLISTLIGLLIYIYIISKKSYKKEYQLLENKAFDLGIIKSVIKFGFPTGIQTLVSSGYFSLLLLFIGVMGDINLTSANIAFTIEGISIFPIFGLATATGILVAQEKGAGRIENISKIIKKCLIIGLCYNVLILLVYNFFTGSLISLFDSGKEVEKFALIASTTKPLIKITAIWICIDSIQLIFGRVLRALGDTLYMMVIYIIIPIIFYIIVPYYICYIAKLSIFWLWIDLAIFPVVMLILVLYRFMTSKWKEMKMI